ncbi:MAG: hydrogen gas-evolving membrane-bound hydrogenase subunit E [Planctomycetota bacterium]
MIALALAIFGVLAAAAPLLHRVAARFSGVLFALVSAGVGGMFLSMAPDVVAGDARAEAWPWIAELGISLSFRVDGLALIFALLICFVGGIVLLYASSYLAGNPRIGSFFAILIGFMASMLGLVVADNLILMFIFWELTSVTSFLLIGFGHERPSARRAAVQALLVTGLGGLALLAGVVMLGLAAGTFELSELADAGLPGHGLYVPIAILILIGCFSKSAIFPLHFWLPNAMEAPSPVSALLHSSTMVKAGVYLIARLHPSMGGTALWDDALIIFGGFTMVYAAFVATRQSTLKSVLAYSTVSSLGVLVMLIGLGAAKAAAAYLLAHALFKACLFLVAGTITQVTGEKNPARLHGLFRVMPIVATASLLGALSFAGMFPFAGFVGKELALKAGLAHPEFATAATITTVVGAIFTVMAAIIVGIGPLFGPRLADSGDLPRVSWRQWSGPLLLAILGVMTALVPTVTIQPLVLSAVSSITGAPYPNEVKLQAGELLWPPSSATALSALVLTLGTALYFGRAIYARILRLPSWATGLTADRAYDAAISALGTTSTLATRFIQSGYLHVYVRATLVAMVVLVTPALVRANALELTGQSVSLMDVVVATAIVCCAVAVVFLSHALAAVAVLGGVGFVMALIFVLYGVPDVAMTQFAVETLIVVIFVLVIYHLPRLSRLTSGPRRAMDAVVALGFGLVMGALALIASAQLVADPASTEHAALSVPGGYGRNVINVILVDFRALDTMGEIFVVGIAAIGVYTLLRPPVRSNERTSP